MKTVIQRVSKASVSWGEKKEEISRGILVLLCLEKNDDLETCKKILEKIPKLRIFEDEQGKTNLSLLEVQGEILWISQFTLAADSSKGNRPSFFNAMEPHLARTQFDTLVEYSKGLYPQTVQKMGFFGESMRVEIVNEGPFTIIYP